MKKQILLFALMLSVASNLFAEEVQIDGLWYNLSETTAEVIQYKDDVKYAGDIVIPSSVSYNNTGYSVTSIGKNAFRECIRLTSITIPNSVTSIGNGAFYWCRSLTSITLPNSITIIEDWAFSRCFSLTSITIPNSVTCIGNSAFRDCSGLTSITIPNSVTIIDGYAFEGCSGLTSIQISESVIDIRYNAFHGTAWYNNQPDGVVYAGKVVYKYKGEMPENTTINITDGTVSISSDAFYECSGLTNISIPSSVTYIGYDAFAGTAWYDNQPDGVVYAGKVVYKYKGEMPENTTIDIEEGTLGIVTQAFSGCTGLKSINIPEGVTSIGDYTFSDCYSLTSIMIPNSVTSIGNSAFYGCTGLTSIMIPNNVTSIGDYTFSDCYSLTSIMIPNSVTSIGNSAFFNCTGLTSIIIPNNVTSIGDRAFDLCQSLTSITIPNSVVNIGDGAFEGCTRLTSITVNEDNASYTSEDGVLFNKDKTILIKFPAEKAMNESNYVIPNSVMNIKHGAFSSCRGLASITIPNSVTNIEDGAFSVRGGLSTIVVEEGNTKYDSRNNCNAIIETSSNTLLVGSNNTVIPDGVTRIGNSAFYSCSDLTSITIPNSVQSIGYYAFGGCYGLTSIMIPNSVESIEGYAFGYCYSLKSIAIPNSVTCIEDVVFCNCNSLTSVTIGNDITSIGDGAFFGCSSLTDLYCYSTNIPATHPNAFETTPISNVTLHVPVASIDVYKVTEPWNSFKNIVICNEVDIEDPAIVAGSAITTEINVSNYDTNLVAFQMDLTLPEGISIDKTGCALSDRITDESQELTIGKLESGAYRITSTSLSLTPISGNDGTLLTLKLTAEEGSVGGQATISNVIFSTSESEKVIMNDKTFIITILNKYNLTYIVDEEVYKTEVVVETTPLTPEAEPTKDGYTFGGWSDVPETMPNHDLEITGRFYLYGDVNTDEDVDVVDVVDIARFVVATPSANFREKLADLNFDKTVNIADAVTLVNHIAGDQFLVKAMGAKQSYNYDLCQIQLLSTKDNALSLSLDGEADFTAFQFEVELPQDVDISAMRINGQRKDGHQLLFNKVADNRYRVTALSTSNAAFKGSDGELLNISINGLPTEGISVQNVLFVTQNGNGVTLDGISLGGPVTEITNVSANESNDIIYDLQGRRLSEPQRGVNIVNGKKVYYNKQ